MGKKYIIELEDKPFHKGNGDFLYRVKGFNSLVFDMTGVGKLTPYTEPDLDAIRNEAYEKGVQDTKQHWVDAPRSCAYKLGYENGINDAWEAARNIVTMPDRGFINSDILDLDPGESIFTKYTAAEAIEKIRTYEQKKQESITAEEVMRQYLDTFCKERGCTGCPLNTPDFTCGRGYHFLTSNPVSDEEVRRAYATVIVK